MPEHGLIAPILALVLWTLVIWIWMYATRIPAIQEAKVDPQEAAERLRRLQELQSMHTRERLTAQVGREVTVLVEGTSARDPGMRCGRTACNKTVNVIPRRGEGAIRSVLVTGAGTHSLVGKERSPDA